MTLHAIRRYRERVDPFATLRGAIEAITAVGLAGKSRPRARHWMRGTVAQPGTTFLYSAYAPGICLVVRDGVVLTVFSKGTCRVWRLNDPMTAEMRAAGGDSTRQEYKLPETDEAACPP